MRDPKRIEHVLNTIREAWEKQPDMRLGQLLIAAIRPKQPCPDLFHMEDGQIEKRIFETYLEDGSH